MSSLTGLSPNNPFRYLGANVALNTVVTRNRAPTGADYKMPETGKLYPFDTYWLVAKDPTTGVQGDLWYLSKIASNVAYWFKLSSGGSGPTIGFIVPFGSSPVFPDANGLVTYTSTGGTIDITGSTNTINFDLSGGSTAIDSVMVDAATPPGTNPVLPTAAGLITVTGAQVAAGTTTNVIRTDSLAANTYTIEIQRSQAVASSTIGDNGVCHFNSSEFTVDANGFVSLGAAVGIDRVANQVFTANGTYTPTAGMVYCSIQCLGGGGGGGGSFTTDGAHVCAAAGGGSGEYAVGIFSAATIGASKAVSIGAGGGGTAALDGTNGGNSSVGALISANGGSGGPAGISTATASNDQGGLGGTGGSGGDYRTPGSNGFNGWAIVSPLITNGGQGASSVLGKGGINSPTTGAGGVAGGYGSGGGGAASLTSAGSDTPGGTGSSGIVIITEYISG